MFYVCYRGYAISHIHLPWILDSILMIYSRKGFHPYLAKDSTHEWCSVVQKLTGDTGRPRWLKCKLTRSLEGGRNRKLSFTFPFPFPLPLSPPPPPSLSLSLSLSIFFSFFGEGTYPRVPSWSHATAIHLSSPKNEGLTSNHRSSRSVGWSRYPTLTWNESGRWRDLSWIGRIHTVFTKCLVFCTRPFIDETGFTAQTLPRHLVNKGACFFWQKVA